MNGSQRQVNLPRLLIFFTTKMGVITEWFIGN
jgi:hypothetical protein